MDGSHGLRLIALSFSWLAASAYGGLAATGFSEASADRGELLQVAGPAAAPGASDLLPARSHTVLGDLSSFRARAVDVLEIAETGDLLAARAPMKELKESWEGAAPEMKPLAPAKWESLEAAIDRAYREVWFWRARRTDSVEALQAVISTIDSLG